MTANTQLCVVHIGHVSIIRSAVLLHSIQIIWSKEGEILAKWHSPRTKPALNWIFHSNLSHTNHFHSNPIAVLVKWFGPSALITRFIMYFWLGKFVSCLVKQMKFNIDQYWPVMNIFVLRIYFQYINCQFTIRFLVPLLVRYLTSPITTTKKICFSWARVCVFGSVKQPVCSSSYWLLHTLTLFCLPIPKLIAHTHQPARPIISMVFIQCAPFISVLFLNHPEIFLHQKIFLCLLWWQPMAQHSFFWSTKLELNYNLVLIYNRVQILVLFPFLSNATGQTNAPGT